MARAGAMHNGRGVARHLVELPGGLEDAVSVAPGRLHSCAALGDGAIRCWGNNTYGQLGNGSDNELRTEPVTVVGIDDSTRSRT